MLAQRFGHLVEGRPTAGNLGAQPLDEQAEECRQPAGVASGEHLDHGSRGGLGFVGPRAAMPGVHRCEAAQPRRQGTRIGQDGGARDGQRVDEPERCPELPGPGEVP